MRPWANHFNVPGTRLPRFLFRLNHFSWCFASSAFSKTSLNICQFPVHILLKPSLENCDHYFASVRDECNCVVVWAFFGIAFLRDWSENWPFPVLWPLLSFPNLLAYSRWTSRCSSWFREGRGTKDQIANICWIIKKAREFQKNI